MQKSHQFVCCKKFIVLKKKITYGKQNGAIKLTSPRIKATKQVYAFSLTIILTFRSKDFIPTLRGDLLSVTNEKFLTFANIYAPNEDKPSFFQNVYEHLSSFKCESIIIGGDFNLVLSLEKDKKGGFAKTHRNGLKTIQEISENLDLLDVWRIYNPDDRRYTWRQQQPKVQCRLDFFLISQNVIDDVTNADIVPGYKTDHSMIT